MKKKLGYKYLLKNIGILTLSSFATKILSFLLVPLYTSVLSTEEYGIFDLFNVTVAVLIPILTLNIQDAVLRFLLDKKANKETIVTISIKYLILSNIIIIIVLVVNFFLNISSILKEYSLVFLLMFFVQSFLGILLNYAKGIDRIKDISISSVITSIVTISLNIVFLVVIKLGIKGYFYANIIGPFVQVIYLIIKTDFFKKIKKTKFLNEEKEMKTYSKPLIANSIAWWINSVSDRYIISYFCGINANGIYAIAGKIPSLLNIFQSIFNQAWTLSVVKDYDPKDENGFFSNTYKIYNSMMVILCTIIIFADKIISYFLYANEFYNAWKYVPWLTIAIVFGGLSGYLGGFFAAVKDSEVFAKTTVIGASINIIFNIIFTPIYGAIGAAIATAISYFITWIWRLCYSKKYIRLKINIVKDLTAYFLLIIQSIVTMIFVNINLYIISGIILLVIVLLYVEDIFLVIKIIFSKGKI